MNPCNPEERARLRLWLRHEHGARLLACEALRDAGYGWNGAQFVSPEGRQFTTLDEAVDFYRGETGAAA